ncbi:sulfatase family protein [Polaribacter cellanae]|uniref:Arylsulfatase n=1 Tax=Polaribacter cellanae TaxID=2818493 RepID=A0A975CRR8_9FLAO|nr:arylsulfatase [Polaribacter cellanae]QTE23694.1 arylsulfatase [Polaribacter cellanae]
MKKYLLLIFSFSLLLISCNQKSKEKTSNEENIIQQKPNIIIFYVDDLGYGDLSSYGAVGVSTPNVDKLAKNGIKYTDAHSSAATCTPSRYSLLTGQYAFRNNAHILPGDAPLLIDTKEATLSKMLKKAGYNTAVVGKWHLGLGNGETNWNEEIKPGPLEIGFDYSFLLPATGDRVPTIFVENHRAINLEKNDPIQINYKKSFDGVPTGRTNPELLRYPADNQHSEAIVNGISRIGNQIGGKSALWTDEDFPYIFTEKANQFIEKNKENPFFLFFSFHDIHVPRLPNKQFQGKSTMGLRGDAIVQMDWMTGQIIKKLEELNIDKNTLVIFTSDNGPVLNDGYSDKAEELLGNHKPSGPFRGGKYSAFEAGTRVPMITYWPGTIKPGESKALISQTDYYTSLANIVNYKTTAQEAIDSKNLEKTLLNANTEGRELLLEESFTLSLRKGDYKYIAPLKNRKARKWVYGKKIESGAANEPQLYDLSKDMGEEVNIAKDNKKLVEKMQAKIDSIVAISKK